MFVLAAEYVSPNLRALMILILWTSSTLALMTLAGIAYIIQNRESLMLTMTFPLLLAILLWRLVAFQMCHTFFLRCSYCHIMRLRDELFVTAFGNNLETQTQTVRYLAIQAYRSVGNCTSTGWL